MLLFYNKNILTVLLLSFQSSEDHNQQFLISRAHKLVVDVSWINHPGKKPTKQPTINKPKKNLGGLEMSRSHSRAQTPCDNLCHHRVTINIIPKMSKGTVKTEYSEQLKESFEWLQRWKLSHNFSGRHFVAGFHQCRLNHPFSPEQLHILHQ